MTKFRFRKHEHLRSPADFRAVYERRCSVSDEWLIVYGRANDSDRTRVGLSVSRKVGGAVQRNRLRRLYREAFRLSRSALPAGIDLVLIPRSAREPALPDLQSSLLSLSATLVQRLNRQREKI